MRKPEHRSAWALEEEGAPLGPATGLLCALGEALATFCRMALMTAS